MDCKHFSKFNVNFKRQAEACIFCHGDLDRVDLSLSNRNELFVRCENVNCKGYTIAEKKKRATGVLNNLVMSMTY